MSFVSFLSFPFSLLSFRSFFFSLTFFVLLPCSQPYTIFHPPEHITGVNTQLSILVKKEPTGEVSKFIHGRKRFNWIELRGPYETKTEILRSDALKTGDAEEEKRNGWSMQGWDRVVMVSFHLPFLLLPFQSRVELRALELAVPLPSSFSITRAHTYTLFLSYSSLPDLRRNRNRTLRPTSPHPLSLPLNRRRSLSQTSHLHPPPHLRLPPPLSPRSLPPRSLPPPYKTRTCRSRSRSLLNSIPLQSPRPSFHRRFHLFISHQTYQCRQILLRFRSQAWRSCLGRSSWSTYAFEEGGEDVDLDLGTGWDD